MLQDPNVERYVKQAIAPLLMEIKALKKEVKKLKKLKKEVKKLKKMEPLTTNL